MVALLGQISRFGVIGIGVTVVYLTLASGLAMAGLGSVPASVTAYCVSTSLSYFGHRRYTFQSNVVHVRAMPRFVVTSGIGLALATAIPLVVERSTGLGPYASFLIVMASVAAFSFIALRLAVFRASDDAALKEPRS